jgi:hypothetical protein
LRSCDWTLSPFAKLQALPLDGLPITKQNDREQAWNETVDQIKHVVEN